MKDPQYPDSKSLGSEIKSLRLLRLSTFVLMIVMIVGFILIVSLLVISINNNIHKNEIKIFDQTISLNENETLNAITYLPHYTIIVFTNDSEEQFIKIHSRKTGKELTNVLLLDLLSKESEIRIEKNNLSK